MARRAAAAAAAAQRGEDDGTHSTLHVVMGGGRAQGAAHAEWTALPESSIFGGCVAAAEVEKLAGRATSL